MEASRDWVRDPRSLGHYTRWRVQ